MRSTPLRYTAILRSTIRCSIQRESAVTIAIKRASFQSSRGSAAARAKVHKPNTVVIETEKVRDATNCPDWIRDKSQFAIKQMLGCVISGISDKGLGINNEPRLSLGLKDIRRVEIGSEQHFIRRFVGQLPKKIQTVLDQPLVRPEVNVGKRPVSPMPHQNGQRPEGLRRRRSPPQSA